MKDEINKENEINNDIKLFNKENETIDKKLRENLMENKNDEEINKNKEVKHDEEIKKAIHKKIRKNSIFPKRFSLIEKCLSLTEMPNSKINNDEEIKNMMKIIEKKYYERNEKENLEFLKFLIKTNIKDKLRSDLLQTDMTVNKLCEMIGQFISTQIFNKYNNIYIVEEKSEIIYIILRGNVGLYKLDISYEEMTFEEYLNYLNDEKKKNDKIIELNEEDKGELGKEFVDDYLLMNIIEDNKSFYNIRQFADIKEIEEILFIIKIYKESNENYGNKLMEIYNNYDFPYSKYNYNNLINGRLNINQFISNLNNFFGPREYFYLQQMNPSKTKIKKLKYIRTNYLNEFDYFGNFELIETKPLRNETARCESSKCLLFAINKKNYGSLINEEQKINRFKDLEKFHNSYFFRVLNKDYFGEKIYSQFKIVDYFLGDELFKENEYFNNFYIIKEGNLEISMSNYSLIELKDLIEKLYKKIKKFIQIDFHLKEKMIHSYNVVKESLNLKRKFLIFTSEKGFYGDYELYFNMPSLFTGTVISKKIKLFLYSFDKFNNLYSDVYGLRESLKNSAFQKLQKIIERLVSIYNSYFSKIENEYTRKQEEQYNEIQEKSKIIKNPFIKSISTKDIKSIAKYIKNNSNYVEYNSDVFKDLKSFSIKNRKKIKNDITKESHSLSSEPRIQNIKKYNNNNNINTIYHSIKINKPERIFLPPIVTSDNTINNKIIKNLINKTNIDNKDNTNNNNTINKNKSLSKENIMNLKKTGFSTSRNKNSSTIFNLKTTESYHNFSNNIDLNSINSTSRIRFPLRIEKNAPLINRIKRELKDNLKEKINKKKKKKQFNFIIRDINHLTNYKKSIEKFPGGYFMAVQQFIDEANDGKFNGKNVKQAKHF